MTIQRADQLALIERYLAAYNSFDVGAMLAVLAPDVRFENYSGDALTAQASGIDEFRRLAEQSRSIFAEREQRIAGLESDGNTIIARIDFHGRLAADIPGGPAAGTVLDLRGESVFTFSDGLIAGIVDRS